MSEPKQTEIRRLSRLAPPTTQAIIGGGLASAASGATRSVVSPIDGSTIAEIPDCDAGDVDRAVAAARRAFEARHWQGMAPKQRKRILARWAELVAAELLPLAVLESRDMGMPVGMAEGFEVAFAVDALRWYAETVDKLYDEMVQIEDNVTSLIYRAPLGVVGAILPWNAPAMIGSWKLGPALATGNSVVLKPAEDASLVLMRIAELALEAGLPEGVLQVVTGDGKVGAALSAHMDVDAITFTGSGEVGRHIMTAAAASNLKRVSLELGGKSANIVMADAASLEAAAEVSVRFMFGNQGQVCEAPTRLLVQKGIREAFTETVVAKARGLTVGDPLELTSDLGPIINQGQREMILGRIARAEGEGTRLALDGRTAAVPQSGYYLAPSVATGVDPRGSLAQEEVFGPVLAVMEFETVDEAIALANSTRYGLGASIWSSNLDTVMYASKRLVAGNIAVNGGIGPVVELPFGGFKQSGFGRDRSLHALDTYSGLKAVTLRTAR